MNPDLSRLPFHPLVAGWFADRFGEPTPPQAAGWREISSGRHTLIAAPTGSGKTLAAFLWWINRLVEDGLAGPLEDRTYVVYVSPLKALGNDIEKNLAVPLQEIRERARAKGVALPEIRVAVRSGDTSPSDRERMRRRPPHILITTPESLFILLTARRSRKFLQTARAVIVDEIHAVAGDKRGSHLVLSLERLDALAGRGLQRIGLSATQKPIDQIAALLVGAFNVRPDGSPDCAVVDVGHRRPMHLEIEIPEQELGPIATHELWQETYERIVRQVNAHRTTLVFVNTRRQVERVAHQLSQLLGPDRVRAHHGSLSRQIRLDAEQRLKSAEVSVVVATASLELGIDIGHVDLVCHVGAPRLLSTLLQRVGRSGHWLGAIPKGIIYPLTRDDLLQAAAAVRAVRAGELDRIVIPENPLDILAQQIVAVAASGLGPEEEGADDGAAWEEFRLEMPDPRESNGQRAQPVRSVPIDELWRLVRRAYSFRNLTREDFDDILEMLSEGIATGRGRRSAHIHRDRVNERVRGRRGARLAAITSGGAIPDVADYDVIEEPTGTFVGKVNEDFAIESSGGDIFLLGNHSWRIRRVESGRVRVEDAQGAPPTIPFWLGEAPARSVEMSRAVADLRRQVASLVGAAEGREAAITWLMAETGVPRAGAEQIVDYIRATLQVLGVVPTMDTVVAERFFDEAGGMQLILHTPFGGRINRAWGLAMRKRFCVTFDFELQAAATDDGIVLSLGEQHSFPLDSAFGLVRQATLEADLTQAILQGPVFPTRWRWNATRALALLRFEGGRKVPMPLQRMRSDDLLAAVFPEQVACQDNHGGGPIIPPDHPLVNETLQNCLREWMDVDGLREVLEAIDRGEIRTVAVETPAPSPMSHEILNANPFAFLDDAPLEERRARAVSLRRTDPDLAEGVGALDPEAIDLVRTQAWPDVRDPDELHDLLLTLGVLPLEDAGAWTSLADELVAAGRATVAAWRDPEDRERRAFIAAERLGMAQAAYGPLALDPNITQPLGVKEAAEDTSLASIVQGWLEILGPTTASALAVRLGISRSSVEIALAALEGRGVVLRGRFTSSAKSVNAAQAEPDRGDGARGDGTEMEWCERRLLARIHRLTLGRLRREIEPVNASDFIRFLLRWQHLAPGSHLHAREGIVAVIRQLQGLELPAPAWEHTVLRGRIARYDPADLEHLCLAGIVAWGRLSHRRPDEEPANGRNNGTGNGTAPLLNVATPDKRSRRSRQAPTRQAPLAFLLREDLAAFLAGVATDSTAEADETWKAIEGLSREAQEVAAYLERRGASFLTDIARGTGLVPATVEDGLWELVARGLVTGDGIAGLRVLLQPEMKRRQPRRRLRAIHGGRIPQRLMPTGRWALWGISPAEVLPPEMRAERYAHQLLRRYGVVFRDVLAREHQAPPWRVLLGIYRRMEARGEIRGGRFVNGFVGEQYALPEAVDALRAVRRAPAAGEVILVSAGDPLNLVGILTPGGRVSPFSNQVIAYRDGVPIEVGPLGAIRSRLQLAEMG